MFPRHYFDLFSPNIDEKLVFIGMSFDPRDQKRWFEIIRPAIIEAELTPYRVDLSAISDSILIDIFNNIIRARILLFDISVDRNGTRNGNVMYELGLAHAMRHPEEVLIIRSDSDRLLFDVNNIRVHTYDIEDTTTAKSELTELLKHLIAGVSVFRNVVLDKIISSLDEVCLGLMQSHGPLEAFSLHDPSKAFEPEAVAARSAIRHMLDLGLLSLHWERAERRYAFVWTYMGKVVLTYLGFDEVRKGATQSFGYTGSQRTRSLRNREDRPNDLGWI